MILPFRSPFYLPCPDPTRTPRRADRIPHGGDPLCCGRRCDGSLEDDGQGMAALVCYYVYSAKFLFSFTYEAEPVVAARDEVKTLR